MSRRCQAPPRASESSSGPRTFFGLPFHVSSVEIHFGPPPGNVVTTLRRDENVLDHLGERIHPSIFWHGAAMPPPIGRRYTLCYTTTRDKDLKLKHPSTRNSLIYRTWWLFPTFQKGKPSFLGIDDNHDISNTNMQYSLHIHRTTLSSFFSLSFPAILLTATTTTTTTTTTSSIARTCLYHSYCYSSESRMK